MELNELEVCDEEPPGTRGSLYKFGDTLRPSLLPFGLLFRHGELLTRRGYHSYLFCVGQYKHPTLVESA